MAALVSPTGKVGMIIQKDESPAVRDAALHGVTDARAAGTLAIAETPDFDMPSYAQHAAATLLAQGVDAFIVLVDAAYAGVHTTLSGVAGARVFRMLAVRGLSGDTLEVLGGVVLHSGGLFKAAIQAYRNGQPPAVLSLGFKEDALELTDFAAGYPANAQAQVNAAVQAIINGTLHP